MRKRTRVLIVVAGLGAAVAALAFPATAANTRLEANLNGQKERPGPGDADATGRAVVNVDPALRRACFNINFRAMQRPFQGHIHRGGPNMAGPIVITLFDPGPVGPMGGTLASGINRCVMANPALLRDIRDRPGAFYVNLHNGQFPAGAIRGQLRRPAP